MKEQIYHQDCKGCPEGHNTFWQTIVESKEWRLWEKEQTKRFIKGNLKEVFDFDECRECGIISPEHWKAFIKFIRGL